MEQVLAGFDPQPAEESDAGAIRIAVIGRPNVGKSTLVNRLLGEERVIASEEPGTTRDSILVPFERDGRSFMLIDTAGVRRRSKVEDVVERASVAKTLQAIDEAHVVIMVLDAHDTVAEQDASVLGIALQRGRALIIAVNKWDGIPQDQRDEIHRQLALKLDFVPFAPLHFISARHGTGVGELMQSTVRAYEAAMRTMPTRELTRTLEHALTVHQPPLVRGRRIKLRYAHQGGRNPPRIIIHGNQTARSRMPTRAIWPTCSARASTCLRRRCSSSTAPMPTPTTRSGAPGRALRGAAAPAKPGAADGPPPAGSARLSPKGWILGLF